VLGGGPGVPSVGHDEERVAVVQVVGHQRPSAGHRFGDVDRHGEAHVLTAGSERTEGDLGATGQSQCEPNGRQRHQWVVVAARVVAGNRVPVPIDRQVVAGSDRGGWSAVAPGR
jgi:hypothetical protein